MATSSFPTKKEEEVEEKAQSVSLVNASDDFSARGIVNIGNTCFFASSLQVITTIDSDGY